MPCTKGLWCYVRFLIRTVYWLILQYFCFNFFSSINIIFVYINLSIRKFVKFLPNKSCDKDNFHPSRDAALLYSPLESRLDGLNGPHGLVFKEYSEIFWKKDRFLHRSREYLFFLNCCCLLRWTIHWVPFPHLSSFANVWLAKWHKRISLL